MLRFYRVFGERIWLILWWMQRKEINFNDIGNAINGSREHSEALTRWQDANIIGDASQLVDDMREELEDQLASSGEHQDGALLSLVIETLNNPYARNVLAGDTLAQLRRGLLLPEEMAFASERINRAEMACSGCGHGFTEREVASYRRNTRSWVCTRCAQPTQVACSLPSCVNGWVKIPAKLMGWLQKNHVCEEHITQAAQPGAPVAEQEAALPGRPDPSYYHMTPPTEAPPRFSGRTVSIPWSSARISSEDMARVTAPGPDVARATPRPSSLSLYAQMVQEDTDRRQRALRDTAARLEADIFEDQDEP